MRIVFQEYLDELDKELFIMANMVSSAIEKSVEALKSQDLKAAKQIRKDDKFINEKRWEIEEKCINLIATQQPVATDLRELIAVLNIITDLERMADYAAGIAKIVGKLGEEPLIKPLIDIPRMADISIDMIHESIAAYSSRDDRRAHIIAERDDDVDNLYHQVQRELISIMIEDPGLLPDVPI